MKVKITGCRKRAGRKTIITGETEKGILVKMELNSEINDIEFISSNYGKTIEYSNDIFDSLQMDK